MKAYLLISAMLVCLIGSIRYADAALTDPAHLKAYNGFCEAYGCVRPSLDSLPICKGKKFMLSPICMFHIYVICNLQTTHKQCIANAVCCCAPPTEPKPGKPREPSSF